MAKAKITKRAVDELMAQAKAQGRTIYVWDEALTGFGVLATKTGSCSYFVEYRLGGRGTKNQRTTIGKHGALTPDEARKVAKEKLGEVAKGINVADQRQTARAQHTGITFAQSLEKFLDVHAKPTRYWHEKRQRMLGADLKKLHGKPIRSISPALLEETLETVKVRNASAHRLLFADLRPFFKWAKKRVSLEANPMADADAPAPAKKRERVLEDHEIKAFWQAASGMEWPFSSIYKLLLLTGARREEVAAMRWAELDGGLWTLPAHDDFVFKRKRRDETELIEGRTKNTREHRVPLPTLALALLNKIAIDKVKEETGHPSDSDFVFSTTGTTPASGFSKAKHRLDLRMAKLLGSKWDAKTEEFVGGKFKPWRVHDLRRTCATGMENLGVDTRVVETALNHVSGTKAGIVGIYQRSEHRDAVAAAFRAWGAHVGGLVGEKLPPNEGDEGSSDDLADGNDDCDGGDLRSSDHPGRSRQQPLPTNVIPLRRAT